MFMAMQTSTRANDWLAWCEQVRQLGHIEGAALRQRVVFPLGQGHRVPRLLVGGAPSRGREPAPLGGAESRHRDRFVVWRATALGAIALLVLTLGVLVAVAR